MTDALAGQVVKTIFWAKSIVKNVKPPWPIPSTEAIGVSLPCKHQINFSLPTLISTTNVCYTRVISLLLYKSEAEQRTNVIIMISSEYTDYN